MTDKHGMIVTIFMVLLMAALPVHATTNKGVLLDELYEQAELEQQLRWIKSSMMMDYSKYDLPTNVINTHNQVVKVRYGAVFFKISMINTLDEALTVDELLQLVEWYDSPLGEKILRLETIANNPMYSNQIQNYIEDRLSKQLPRSSRSTLVEELMVAQDVVEHGTELAAAVSVGVFRLLRELMPMMGGGGTESSMVLKAKEKPKIRRDMLERMKGIMFYTYRGLSDQEIRRYLHFSQGTAMQNFQRGQVQAVARML